MMLRTEQEIMSNWDQKYRAPLVTVRCLTYNHAKYICNALDGFLCQITSFPFEVLIHDDASTDGTIDLVKEYVAKYPNIIIPIIQKENQYSKNPQEIRKAINPNIHGKYVAMCEGDDYWTDPRKLEKQIMYMEKNTDCSMTIHAVNYEQDGCVIKNDRISDYERDISVDEMIYGGGMLCATASICCRTELFLDYPKWRNMAKVGDYPLQILMAVKGRVHYFPEIMGVYRYMAQGSWTRNQQNTSIGNNRRLNEIEWLSELNKSTQYQYDKCISERIGFYIPILYKAKAIKTKAALKYIRAMHHCKNKYVYYCSIIKHFHVKTKL